MCLALTVAYYLNLDEPYWAMTSAAVVSFPTVGALSVKASGAWRVACWGQPPHCFAGHTLNDPALLLSMSAWLGLCTGLRSFYQ